MAVPISPQLPSARLISLTIEGFRGFQSEAALDFDASAVLLWGPNGTGKTSVFDAVQWLLVGDVARLKQFTLRKNEDYIVSTYRRDGPAVVEALFRTSEGAVSARRVGNTRGTSLEVTIDDRRISGSAAEVALHDGLVGTSLPLGEALATTGLLQQDDLRQLLHTKADHRYRQLLRLLGLEVLERFERFAGARRDRARVDARDARAALDRLQSDLQGLEERAETARITAPRLTDLSKDAVSGAAATYSDVLRLSRTMQSPAELAGLAATCREIASTIQNALAALEAVPNELPTVASDTTDGAAELLEQALAAAASAHDDAQRAQASAQAAARSQDAVARLAAAAIPFLPTDTNSAPCPVCETVIDPGAISAALSARAEGGAALAAAEATAAAALQRVADAESAVDAARERLTEIDARSRERTKTLGQLRSSLAMVLGATAGTPGDILSLPVADSVTGLFSDTATVDDADFERWRERRDDVLEHLARTVEALVGLAAAADSAAAAQNAAQLATDRAAALPRFEAQLSELRQRIVAQETLYETARRKEALANSLAQQGTAAATEIFRDRFTSLAPLMNDIYARLDPHPAFTELDFRVETYRSRGTASASVIDRDAQIEANPMLVFSAAQANSVVIAAFLALGWAAGSKGLPFVLLDDPLQAMDDVNVLGFADVLRRIRRQKQVIVATHEERFAQLLERKLRGRSDGEDLLVHEFTGWSRLGPSVQTRRVPPTPALQSVLAS